ncbi:MAG: tripartite tricarboxylate transporter TctB family protein [Rhizobiaceae bacterium]
MSDSRKTSPKIDELVEPRHHRAEIVFGLAAFAIGLFLATQLGSQLTWKDDLPLSRQPGFFSSVAVVGMLVFGAMELWFAWRRNATGRGERVLSEIGFWAVSAEYAVWFMVYVLVVPRLGYLPTTLIFCLLLTLRVGYRRTRTLLASLLVGVATVLVFKGFLSVKIPGGALYEQLPDALRNFMILYF